MNCAIKQDGSNQVNIITSTAERQASIEFAKAAGMRPQIMGAALQKISQDPQISDALFQALEIQYIIEGQAVITLVPRNSSMFGDLVWASQVARPASAK